MASYRRWCRRCREMEWLTLNDQIVGDECDEMVCCGAGVIWLLYVPLLCAPLTPATPSPLLRLSVLRQGHNINSRRFDQIQEDLHASSSAIERLEGSSEDVADQYKFLQEMRGYVRDLLECFSEKVREKQLAPSYGCCALSKYLMLLDPV